MDGRGMLEQILDRTLVVLAAAAVTFALFLFLPLMQAIGDLRRDSEIRTVDTTSFEPPPPPPEEEVIEEQPPPEPPPPQLAEEAPPLELAQLELALNPTFGDSSFGGIAVGLLDQLATTGNEGGLDRVFSLGELDQKPRPIFQRSPSYPPDLWKARRQGTVHVLFTVDERGRVQDAQVEQSTDPAFNAAALEAVRSWKFEPGTRQGQAVSFKMKIPISFNPQQG